MKTFPKVYTFSLLASSLAICATLAFAKEEQIKFKTPNTLTVCSYSEFQPVSYGNGEGYEPDMLRAIAKLWDVKIKFIPEKTFADIWLLPSKKSMPCDVASAGITPTDYRIHEMAAFSKPTTSFAQSLLVRKKDYDSKRITSYRSFLNSDMKIGVVPETTGEKYAHVRAKDVGLSMSAFVQYES